MAKTPFELFIKIRFFSLPLNHHIDFMDSLKEFFSYELFTISDHIFTIGEITSALIFIVIAKIVMEIFKRFFLKRLFDRKGTDEGTRYSITRLIKYTFYFITILLIFQILGIKANALIAIGAALMVGIGIGLQQTFNDLLSGIILLVEGSVKKGDWIKIDNYDGEVQKIGLRTSVVKTRTSIYIIVPNSKITVDNVFNYSHVENINGFIINVGIAYGSDVNLVKKLLLDCAKNHNEVFENPSPKVRFKDFGSSSLDFELIIWVNNFKNLEDITSDIRFSIDEAFRNNDIEIPFPQRDLNVKVLPKNLKLD